MENLYQHLVLLFLFLLLTFKFLFKLKKNLPPSPIGIPIIGHLHLINQPLYLALEALLSKYGPIIHLRFGYRSVLVTSSPSAVEECLTKNDLVFANRPRSISGDIATYNYSAIGFAAYGHIWRSIRKLLVVEIFSLTSIQKFSSIREDEVHQLLHRLFKMSKKGIRKVELKYFSSILTFNVVTRMVAGRKCIEEEDVEKDEGGKLLDEMKVLFVPITSMTVCDFVPFLRWVGYKGVEKGIKRMHKKRDAVLQGLVDEVRCKKTSMESETTVVGTLLSLQESDPEFYSGDVIKGVLLLMFLAGTDTSSVTIEWAMSLLLNHPEALKKLRAEIDNNVEQGHLLDESDIPNLPYLRCVIKETLRLYPPTPLLLPHFSSEDCTVERYKIPRGTTLLVNAWAMHRDPMVWEDAAEFMPERFKGMEGERDGYKFVPFGAGRRICLGAAMGMRIVSLTLGTLIQCFDWERVGTQKVDMSQDFGLTMPKAKPLVAMFSPRQICSELFPHI